MSLSHSPRAVSDSIVMDLKASSLSTSISRNLFTSPEEITSTHPWYTNAATVQNNAAIAPDGTMTADKVIGNFGVTSRKSVYQYVSGLRAGDRYTFSVYLKSAGYTTASMWHDNNPYSQPGGYQGAGALLDLITGVSSDSTLTTMTSVGNGWYRCQVTAVYPYSEAYTYSIALGAPNGGAGTPNGDGVNGIFVWGAQLERTGQVVPLPSFEVNFNLGQTSSLITYTRSTVGTFYNSSGLIATAAINAPRYDYDPVTFTNRGLLLEAAATNWIPNSTQSTDQFTVGFGGVTKNLATSNNPSSASAVSNSVRALAASDTFNQIKYMLRSETWGDGQANIFSAFFKQITANITYPALVIDFSSGPGIYARFDLSGTGAVLQGAITGAGATYLGAGIERLPNGWYRCWVSGSITGGAGSGRASITIRNNTSTTNGYDPASVLAVGDGVYVWGPMIEKNVGDRRKPSSYYETTGSTATRGADSAAVTGSNFTSFFNNVEGTILVEYYRTNEPTFGGFTWPVSISDGTINNQISFYNINGGTAVTNIFYQTGGTAQLDYLQVNTNVGINKLAQSYKTNQVAFAANGSLVGVDYTNTTPVVNRLTIGNSYAGSNDLNDRVSRIVYWPKALTPTEVTALTNLWSSLTTTVGVQPTTYYPVSSNVLSTTWTDSSTSIRKLALTQIQVLVVAGGGAGAFTGSGGGAGGVLYNANFPVAAGTSYTATVGAGGFGAPNSNGQAGANSVFGSLTAFGGGGGVTHGSSAGQNGGSGGGAAQVYTAGTSCSPGLGTDGQGFMGGQTPIGVNDWPGGSAGGGGAGGPGQRGGANIQGYGNGGIGRFFPQFSSIGGSPAGWFGGGGGGGEVSHGFITEGGLGGGGTGTPDAAGSNGVANTGGGGAGGGYSGPYFQGGNGGSGIVIIRYPQPVRATGGTITLVGTDVVHTFTSGTSNFVVESSSIQLKNLPAFNAVDTSITLNGVNQYVDCGSASVLDVGNTITVIAWFKPQSISTYGPIVAKLTSDYLLGWEFAASSGTLRVSLRPGPSANLDLTAGSLALNTWFMGAFTFDGTTCRLYLNGNQTVSGTPTGPITLNSTQSLWIGARVQGNYFAGDISQVTMYSRVLTANEILQNFNASRGKYGI